MSESASLLGMIQELIDSGNLELPVFNEAAAKLQMLSTSEDVSADEVERLILADQVLVAEILRAANSCYYGGLSQIHTVRNAIVRLGLRQVAHLALLASHRSKYDAKDPDLRQMIQQLWGHASATALAAGWLARRLGFGAQVESESFLGGLLHDVGKLVILRAIDEIKLAGKAPCDLSQHLVDEILDAAHPDMGFNFLKHWDIPNVYCEIARDHHREDFDAAKIPLVTVRLANNVGAKIGLSLRPNAFILPSSLPEAQCLNASEVMLVELELMMEDTLSVAS